MVTRTRQRTAAAVAAAIAAIGVGAALIGLGPETSPADAAPRTIVSLTFDDANANQAAAVELLDQYDMDGTFFVPSGYVGAPGHLTLQELEAMAASGHEIGGHTVSHADLTAISADEAARQVCYDRAQLTTWGFTVRSFAYPFARVNGTAKDAVAGCGYSSARGLGDIDLERCRSCRNAESLPPADPFETKAPPQVETGWTLGDLQGVVRRAEHKGGWAQLTFHNVCVSGCDIAVSPQVFEQFLAWLQSRRDIGTVVRTVGDAIGGPAKPIVDAPAPAMTGPGENAIANAGYEDIGPDGAPRCWMRGGYGTNAPQLDATAEGRGGSMAARVHMGGYVDGDAKWLSTFDLGECAPTVGEGRQYSLRSWYTATTVTQFAVYLRDTAGRWHYWTSSPWFGASATFQQAVWTTPQIPEGMTGISFGLNLFGDGTLVTDDVEMFDAEAAPEPAARAAATPAVAPAVAPAVEPQGHPAAGD
ncbi:polysaccharide deacetylase [Aeromicrobium phragmitis]|uniref:Polysaccharide deacetylase n=1 Tax=Aeromicrobium phragmitis TaxID=2478914 RepID=A0A3L8PNW3_9ACTN|nr:polysaccharide deacetylase family protein [Aeromicrobium phragmitis]RLV55682.1 polysaccharide deacetylase [Aeromicrobium phragmitis]